MTDLETSQHFVVCINNDGYPASLETRKIYVALTDAEDWVLAPYAGVGSSLIAGLKHDRRVIGCDKEPRYTEIARQRIRSLAAGTLKTRALGTRVHVPTGHEKVSQMPLQWVAKDGIRRKR